MLGCASVAPASPGQADASPDAAAAAEQARTFHTIATQDTYGNYGEQFSRFCQVRFNFDCNREGRDLTEGSMSSAQEIGQWEAEKNNPQSVVADIGILFIPQGEEVGVLADYEAPNATLLPDDLHGPGWVATFTGVPTILVNLDSLESRGLEVPESWADLTDPSYAGLVGLGRDRRQRQRHVGVRGHEPGRGRHARRLAAGRRLWPASAAQPDPVGVARHRSSGARCPSPCATTSTRRHGSPTSTSAASTTA